MRAAVLSTPGEAPVHAEHPDPAPAAGRAVVRVTAAPIVPLDQLAASGTSYFGRPAVPYVPGVQGVGVVEESAAHPAGTRVWFATSAGMAPGDGSLAERCTVAEADLVPVDVDLPDASLAAMGLSAVAAWMVLADRARLAQGETVLVLGAGGAVGQAAIGAARVLGAGRVVAVCRSTGAQERARRLGADAVVPLEGDVDALTGRFADACGGRADVVVDPVFGIAATAASRVLADHGRLVNLGGASGDVAEFSSAVLRSRSADVLGYTNNALTPAERADALASVARHAAQGRISVAHEVLPLEAVSEAWTRQAEGRAAARLVLTP
ncbi:quinone oxidoreductase family protein [Blastococcus tunisiensis]|uniref:NADPH:quinone reductase n=1 Tax=Blastococcus tunisiensis TaxID=1798228 RepID=A0A1I2M5U9_9ACTN|nr:zinc-binding dehydrogenase [Blastococcus sp. DSM 46838]SFF84561.1 NADPH:quinone reductase [Blastococcus sp. DSM 46838]